MARILPDPLLGPFPPEVLRVHRALKAIAGDDFLAWVGLPLPGSESRPDFLVVHDDSTAFVLSICPATESDIEERLHGGLWSTNPATAGARADPDGLGGAERRQVNTFIQSALAADRAPDGSIPAIPPTPADEGPPAVYGLVLFPNAPHELLRRLWPDNPHAGCHWLGEEYLPAEKLAACLRKLATGGLQERHLARLRSRFTPETVVPERFSPRPRGPRDVGAAFTPLLLDYDQEAWTKNRLRLPEEAQALAETQSGYGETTLVTGVAGSGKSLVLLFRACTQARLDPHSRALVLTHNKALRRELETRFGELGRPPNVEWHTFFSWIQVNLPGQRHVVQYAERDELIARAIRATGATVTGRWMEFLRDEFDWMQDRDVVTLEAYLAAERAGRGVRLTAEQRGKVHAIHRAYLHLLDQARAEDWSGRALRFWHALERGEIRPALHDYIYVDEAQFFAPVWLRALRAALRPGTGRLLLAADPTQGFLKRRQSWVACGLDVRGRSTRLRRSYRNTREILAFAADFYRARLGSDEETGLNLPDAAELASADPGEAPRVVPLASRQDEVSRAVNEIAAYLDQGGSPDAVLVLVTSGRHTGPIHDELVRAFGAHRVSDARETVKPGAIRVCSLNGATGLEAPLVFILGGAELIEPENDLQTTAEERQELRRDNTRRLYMGFTRAGQRLVITWTGAVPDYLRPPATA